MKKIFFTLFVFLISYGISHAQLPCGCAGNIVNLAYTGCGVFTLSGKVTYPCSSPTEFLVAVTGPNSFSAQQFVLANFDPMMPWYNDQFGFSGLAAGTYTISATGWDSNGPTNCVLNTSFVVGPTPGSCQITFGNADISGTVSNWNCSDGYYHGSFTSASCDVYTIELEHILLGVIQTIGPITGNIASINFDSIPSGAYTIRLSNLTNTCTALSTFAIQTPSCQFYLLNSDIIVTQSPSRKIEGFAVNSPCVGGFFADLHKVGYGKVDSQFVLLTAVIFPGDSSPTLGGHFVFDNLAPGQYFVILRDPALDMLCSATTLTYTFNNSPTLNLIADAQNILPDLSGLSCPTCKGKKFNDSRGKASTKLNEFINQLANCNHKEALKKLKEAAHELDEARKEALKESQTALVTEIDNILAEMVQIALGLADAAHASAITKNSTCSSCDPNAGNNEYAQASTENKAEKKIEKYGKAFEKWARNHCDYYDATCGSLNSCKMAEVDEAVETIALTQLSVYPNPFLTQTTIEFSSAVTQNGYVKVFNLMGAEIATLFDGLLESGRTETITFRPENLAPGVYIIRMETASGEMKFEKLVLQR